MLRNRRLVLRPGERREGHLIQHRSELVYRQGGEVHGDGVNAEKVMPEFA